MKIENYKRIQDLMQDHNALEKRSHELMEAKHCEEEFRITTPYRTSYVEIDRNIALDALDSQIAKVNYKMAEIKQELEGL